MICPKFEYIRYYHDKSKHVTIKKKHVQQNATCTNSIPIPQIQISSSNLWKTFQKKTAASRVVQVTSLCRLRPKIQRLQRIVYDFWLRRVQVYRCGVSRVVTLSLFHSCDGLTHVQSDVIDEMWGYLISKFKWDIETNPFEHEGGYCTRCLMLLTNVDSDFCFISHSRIVHASVRMVSFALHFVFHVSNFQPC